MSVPPWWKKPRTVSVVVDNDSWILPFATELVDRARTAGDDARLVRAHADIPAGGIAFYLGCVKIAQPEVLARNHRNLVVHESDLPLGRGFAPVAWQILEGAARIPVCLFEAGQDADCGPVVIRDGFELRGDELLPEWRDLQGRKTVELCLRFLAEASPSAGIEQQGQPTHYARRRPADSRLDPGRTIAEQFELLRVVDNERFPAFFEFRGRRYRLRIERDGE